LIEERFSLLMHGMGPVGFAMGIGIREGGRGTFPNVTTFHELWIRTLDGISAQMHEAAPGALRLSIAMVKLLVSREQLTQCGCPSIH